MSTIWLSTPSRLDEVSSASRRRRLCFKRRRDRNHAVTERAATQLEARVGTTDQIEETSISVSNIGRYALELKVLCCSSAPTGGADGHEIRGFRQVHKIGAGGRD